MFGLEVLVAIEEGMWSQKLVAMHASHQQNTAVPDFLSDVVFCVLVVEEGTLDT